MIINCHETRVPTRDSDCDFLVDLNSESDVAVAVASYGQGLEAHASLARRLSLVSRIHDQYLRVRAEGGGDEEPFRTPTINTCKEIIVPNHANSILNCA